MRAAVLEKFNEPLVIRDVTLAEPGPSEVLVQTAAVGICHSDLHCMQGTRPGLPMPTILGHEVAGIVRATGPGVRDLQPGDHVVGTLGVYCGCCPQCIAGRMVLCSDTDIKLPPGKSRRISAAGGEHIAQWGNLSGFAEQLLVHRNALVKIRKDMPLDRAALLGCAVTTGTGAVFRTSGVQAGATVAIVGCGGVGLSTVNAALIAGASRIIAIDTVEAKLEMAKLFGATDTIDASKVDVVATVKELTTTGVEHAFECVGLPVSAEQCYRMLCPGGRATIVGVFAPGVKLSIEANEFLLEKQIRGSMLGSSRAPEDIPRLVELYMQGRLKLDELISRRLPLEDINEGFAAMQRGEVARSVVVFDVQ